MSDEQWLREGLASAVPEPPANPDRGRAATRLARRRRTTALAVVGTAGVVAAAAVLTAALTRGEGTSSRDHSPAAVSDGVVECPEAPARGGTVEEAEIDRPDPDAPGAVPSGATSARLCQGPGLVTAFPADALVTGVDGLIDELNALEPVPAPEMCTHDLGPGFRIALGYDDGSSFVVSGQLYGCQTLVVGNGYRADPQRAQEEFLTLLEAQREAATPPESTGSSGAGDPVATACPDHPGLIAFDDLQDDLPDAVPAGATSARLCTGSFISGVQPLDALTTDVATLVDAVNGLPEGESACTDEGLVGYRLVFGYPDGSTYPVAGVFSGCGYVVAGSGYRDDPEVPLETFVGLLREQRATQSAPYGVGEVDPPRCGEVVANVTHAVADPTEMVAARLCIGRAEITIPAEDLPALIEDLRTHQSSRMTVGCRAISTRIVGITRWGDPFSLHSECGTDSYELPGAESLFWNTSRDVELLLERLVAPD